MYITHAARFNKQNVNFRNVKERNIQIFVKTILGNTISIDTNNYEDIKTLKHKIYNKTGVETKKQRLIFAGKQLSDKKNIVDYNIKKHSTIHLSSRLLGGGSHGPQQGGQGGHNTTPGGGAATAGPTSHQTGTPTTTGGTSVSGYFNSTNTGVDVSVPVPNDASYNQGTISIKTVVIHPTNGAIGTLVAHATTHTITSSDFGTSVTINIPGTDIQNINGYAEGVDISFGSAIDGSNNTALSVGQTSTTALTVDTVKPTMTISATDANGGSLTSGATSQDAAISLKFTSDSATTDFVQGDIDLSGGTLSNWTPTSSTVYDASFTPNAGATVITQIDVDGGKFTDAAGNNNDASNLFKWTYGTGAGGGGSHGGGGATTIDLSANPATSGPKDFVNVNENVATSFVVTTISDKNNLAHSFSFDTSTGDHGKFDIDASSGVITFKASPDFEDASGSGTGNANIYELTIDASGTNVTTVGGANGTSYQFQIKVQNLADTIDLSANSFTIVSGNIDVSENTTAVTTISDLDNTANSFDLSGADAGSFSITNAGVLTFNTAPDFETPGSVAGTNAYSLTVDASNNNGTVTTVGAANGPSLSFTVNVKDVNFDKTLLNLSPASNSTFEDAEITYTLNEDVSGVRVIWEETSTVGGPFVRHDPVELNSQYWVAGTHSVDSSANWTSNGNTTNATWKLKLQVNKTALTSYPAVTHASNHAVSTNLTYVFDISDTLINLRGKTSADLNKATNLIIEDTTDISAGGLSVLVSKTTSQLKLFNNPDISGSFVDLSNVLLGGTPRLDASDCDVTVNDAISVPDFKKLDDVLDNNIILTGGIKVNVTSDFVSGQDIFKQDLSNVFIQDGDVNVTVVNNITATKYNRIDLNTTGSITTQGTGVGSKLNKANNKASSSGLGGGVGGATRLAKMKKSGIPVKAGTTKADKDDTDYKDALAAIKTEISSGSGTGATSKKQKRRAAVALLTSNNTTIKQFPMKKEDLGFNDKTKFKTDDIVVIVPGETVDIAAIRALTSNNSTGFVVMLDDGEETTLTVGTGKNVKIVREDSGANERYKIDTLTGITHSDFKKVTG